MATSTRVVGEAARRYRTFLRLLTRPFVRLEAEAHHLREVEQAGESGETPYIAMLGLALFLASVGGVMLGLALVAYFVA